MVRLEFVKGEGGVKNIINGNIREIDRNDIDNIEDIDKVLINALHFSPIGFNFDLKAIQIAGYIIVFNELSDMEPYLQQIDVFDGEIFNPGVDGVKYPEWDVGHEDPYKNIVAHTYTNTDIEKDLIDDNN